jgi:hypothetical protein
MMTMMVLLLMRMIKTITKASVLLLMIRMKDKKLIAYNC